MWGKTWEEAIGKTCLELGYEPWHAAMHDREIDQVVATKQPIRGEVPFTGTFGRRIYDYIFLPIIGEHGEVEAVAGTTRDVTEGKEAELRLAESEEQFRTLFTIMSEGYCIIELIYDEQSQPSTSGSSSRTRRTRCTAGCPTSSAGRCWKWCPDTSERLHHWLRAAWPRRASCGRYVDRVAALDRWFEVSCRTPAGRESAGCDSLQRCVRKETREENLAASERQLAEVFKHALPPVGACGPEHVFERVNARYEQVVGGRSLVGQRARRAAGGRRSGLHRVARPRASKRRAVLGTDVRVFLDQGDGRSRDEHYIDFVSSPPARPERRGQRHHCAGGRSDRTQAGRARARAAKSS